MLFLVQGYQESIIIDSPSFTHFEDVNEKLVHENKDGFTGGSVKNVKRERLSDTMKHSQLKQKREDLLKLQAKIAKELDRIDRVLTINKTTVYSNTSRKLHACELEMADGLKSYVENPVNLPKIKADIPNIEPVDVAKLVTLYIKHLEETPIEITEGPKDKLFYSEGELTDQEIKILDNISATVSETIPDKYRMETSFGDYEEVENPSCFIRAPGSLNDSPWQSLCCRLNPTPFCR